MLSRSSPTPGTPTKQPPKRAVALSAALLPHNPSPQRLSLLAALGAALLLLVLAICQGAPNWQRGPAWGGFSDRLLVRQAAADAWAGQATARLSAASTADSVALREAGDWEEGAGEEGGTAMPSGQQQQQQPAAAVAPKCPDPPPCPACPKAPACPTLPPAPTPPQRLRMPWQPLLPRSAVRRGLSYYGTGDRLQAVVARLQAGQPIKAYTLGGSVTRGQGASDEAEKGYAGRFFQFINATWPHRNHVLSNKGIGGTSSGVFAACAEQMVGTDPDLVIVEFTLNDKGNEPFKSPHRRAYEQLLRKLLLLPGPPAVILLHHYAWWRSLGDSVPAGLFYKPQAEEQLTVLSQYYDLPSISARAALYHLQRENLPGFKVSKVWDAGKKTETGERLQQADEDELDLYFYNDRTHPNDRGHQMYAELLASVLLKAAAEQSEGWEAAVGEAAGWADEPVLPRSTKGKGGSGSGYRLPPPMIPGTADVPTSVCAIQEGFKDIVVAHSGFDYRPDRPKEKSFVGQKWGWTGTEPGAWVELQFDSRDPGLVSSAGGTAPGADKQRTGKKEKKPEMAEVYLTHLKGYEGFGTASVACVSGCSCSAKGRVLDGTWEQQNTLMQIHRFQVSQHPKCRVRVMVRKEPGAVPQKGHKVTLSALMVAHFQLRLRTFDHTAEEAVAALV